MTENTKNAAEWFEVKQIDNRTWVIDDRRGCDLIYLISGEKHCLLLDTGWGVGNLPALVNSLVSLPVIVVNSHGHPDHSLGNAAFDQVQIHMDDVSLVQVLPLPEERRWVKENTLPKPLPSDFTFDTWAISGADSLIPFQDRHIFDLGNRTLEVIAVPGHTPGSICLLDRQARFLFVGDTIVPGAVWLHLDESLPLRQFHQNLQRLQGFTDEFDHILSAHGDVHALPLPKSMLDELIRGIELILSGKLVGQQEETFAGNGLRCDFESCGIVYRPDRM